MSKRVKVHVGSLDDMGTRFVMLGIASSAVRRCASGT